MKKIGYMFPALMITLNFMSCTDPGNKDRSLIINIEIDFAKMAEEQGIAEAFYMFAADSAVINRGGKLIKGKEAIRNYYQKSLRPGTRLLWTPDFADVSSKIGYTYGRFTLIVPDSSGNMTETKGIFHTVWQKQPDGSWKFVWD